MTSGSLVALASGIARFGGFAGPDARWVDAVFLVSAAMAIAGGVRLGHIGLSAALDAQMRSVEPPKAPEPEE